jgi:4-amino-4-deoxy-L-arabinose transferase-like glycosyltransferase
MSSKSKKFLVIVAIFTCIANGAILFVVIPHFSARLIGNYNQDTYADGYDELAASLASGNGYRFYPDTAKTLMREPGYPLVLAGIFVMFGNNLAVVKLTNMFLALTSAWLVLLIARKVSSSQIVIYASPLLFLFHPGVLVAESRGGVEILFTFLLTLFVFTLYSASESNKAWQYLISGGVLGLAVLVKSTPMLFPIALLVYLFVFGPRRNPRLVIFRNITLMVIAMVVVLSPWIIRNYMLTGKFVPTASVLGISAHSGQYLCKNLSSDNLRRDVDRAGARERKKLAEELGYPFKDIKDAYYQYFYSSDDELKFSSFLFKRVMSEYETTPTLFAKCAESNLFDFWFAGKTWQSTKINLIIQLPYLILGVIGTALCVKNGQGTIIGPLVLLIAYTVAVYAPILAQARYSVTIIPFLSILASVPLGLAQKWLTVEDPAGSKVSIVP